MPAPGRKIENIRPETPVRQLAHEASVQRLAAVTSLFPLAAEGVIDEHERVHQLRVATRRAVAALVLFNDFCPRRRTKKLIRKLKEIRRAAGKARDLDVFMAHLASDSGTLQVALLQELAEHRRVVQTEIAELFERIVPNERLARRIQSVTDRIRPRTKQARKWSRKPVENWAPKRLRKAAAAFLEVVPESLDQQTALHPLRIEGKRLRYSLELLAAGIPLATYESLYPLLEELQDRLGTINDHFVAIDRLETHFSQSEERIENERIDMESKVAQFGPWFRDIFLPRFQKVIDET